MSKAKVPKPKQSARVDIDELLASIQASLGAQGVVMQRGSDLEGRFDLRRPCGIPSLDIATGGGLPAGGLSQIDGPEGTGKNLLIYHYFAKVQRLYKANTKIFMLCMEFPFDKMFAHKIGFRVPFSDYEIEVERRGRKERAEEPLPTPVAREHAPGPVAAVGGRRQAHDEQAGLGIAEARHGSAPIGPVAILPAFFFGDPLAIGHEPGTESAGSHPLLEDGQAAHGAELSMSRAVLAAPALSC